MQSKYLDSHIPSIIFTVSNPLESSAMWNFMMSCRSVVTSYISWEVHDGVDIHFWNDFWNGHLPLKDLQALQVFIPILI